VNDIDFEELDRAVSSALGPDAVKTPAATAEAPAPAPAPSTPAPVPTPPASASPAARRSSGRFMDVVHPSSDMRSGGGSTQSRPLEVPPRPASTPVADEKVEEAPSTQGSSFQWPDPLDMAESTKTESDSESQGSPFMNTEKIEKRPLGAFSSEKASEEPKPLDAESKPESEPASEAPAETPQLIAEAGAVDVSALDMSEEALVGGTKQADTEPEASSVPTEITQQYKEQPSTTEQPSGAIYDTESYHKPLAHPAKKQSSVLVIVWIIGLILLGGGLGAAMYFFVLPLL